ncbi:Mss4-like protein [Mycena floridula]|nr:Mss4-like protein [Mycena floridula]
MTDHREPIHGGCLCGSIRYTISFSAQTKYPLEPHCCQCTMCRKAGGTLVTHFLPIDPSQITWQGTPKVYETSKPGIFRDFCPDCGSTLTWRSKDAPSQPDVYQITCGTLDEEVLMGPNAKNFTFTFRQYWCCHEIEGVTDNLGGVGERWVEGDTLGLTM